MSLNDKVIITCAVTGAIHTPSMSPYLPVTPEEIAEAAVGAAEAGAAVQGGELGVEGQRGRIHRGSLVLVRSGQVMKKSIGAEAPPAPGCD